MSILIIVLIALIVITGVSSYFIISKAMARKSAILKEAEAEGEMIKKERILQAKKKFIQLKSEHDRVVNERNQKIAQSEQRAKQPESTLHQQQEELNKKIKEQETLRGQLSKPNCRGSTARKRRSTAKSRSRTYGSSRSAA